MTSHSPDDARALSERLDALQAELAALRERLETQTEDIEAELRRQADVIDALHLTVHDERRARRAA